MKGVAAALVIAAAIITGSILYTNHLTHISEELTAINDAVMAYIEEDNYAAAAKETEKMHNRLEDKRTVLAATGSHEMLDDIEMNLFELSGYIEGGQKFDAVSRCRVLGFLLEHLPKDYKIKLDNIL